MFQHSAAYQELSAAKMGSAEEFIIQHYHCNSFTYGIQK
jgi:hypothetical protein